MVTEARNHIKAICQKYGAAHFQIGRTYPYRESRDAAFRDVLDAVKAVVDPKGLFNPGGLGFPRMSETYRAIRHGALCPELSARRPILSKLPLTAPGPGEVRVRNRYCGVNAIFDTQIARNAVDYVKIGLPTFTGVEALGVVDAVGEGVTGFAPGDAAVTVRFTGGYREANVAPGRGLRQGARSQARMAGAGLDRGFGTGRAGADRRDQGRRDGRDFGGGGRAGAFAGATGPAARLPCHRRGRRAAQSATSSRSLGAQRVIDYKSEDVAAVLAAEYPKGIDLAVDTVSGAIYDAFLANIAYHGRLVVGGAASDLNGKPEMVTAPRIAHAIYYKGASVRGFMNGLLTPHWADARARLFALYREGKLKVCLDEPALCRPRRDLRCRRAPAVGCVDGQGDRLSFSRGVDGMTDGIAMDRRALMASGLALGAAASIPASATGTRVTGNPLLREGAIPLDPAKRVAIARRMRFRTDAGPVFWWFRGRNYAQQGAKLIPMCELIFGALMHVTPRADGGMDVMQYELGFRTALDSGERAEKLRNPITGELVDVPFAPVGPTAVRYSADNVVQLPESIGGSKFSVEHVPELFYTVGNTVCFQTHTRATSIHSGSA